MSRRRFTDKEESAIRRRIFKLKEDPATIRASFNPPLSDSHLRRIAGGALPGIRKGIEAYYK